MGLAHSPRIVTDGLVLALDAGNTKSYPGSGTTWTELIGEREATLNNSPTHNSKYFTFNGTDENAVFSSSVEISTAGFSMAFLMRVADLQNGSGWHMMLGDKDSPNGSFEIGIYGSGNRTFAFKDNDQTSGNQTVTTDLGSDWVYLVFGMNSSLYPWIYLNGEFKTQLGTTFTSATLDFTQLFSYNSSNYFKGDFSCIQLYSKSLSASEISQNFNAFRGRFGI